MTEPHKPWIVIVDRPGHSDAELETLRYRIVSTWLDARQRGLAAARRERPSALYTDVYLTVEGDPSLGSLAANRDEELGSAAAPWGFDAMGAPLSQPRA